MTREEKKSKWIREQFIDENTNDFYVYAFPNSYEVKEELKAAGFRFNGILLWHAPTIPAGYEDKVVKFNLLWDNLGQYMAWGSGAYFDNAQDIVKNKIKEAFPPEEIISNSEWFGEVGKRIKKIPATLKSIRDIDTRFGGTQLVTFEDEEENIIIWWTSVEIQFEIGDKLLLTGTIKAHEEFRSVKQTVMTRCKLEEV